jgi:hypothetical protein
MIPSAGASSDNNVNMLSEFVLEMTKYNACEDILANVFQQIPGSLQPEVLKVLQKKFYKKPEVLGPLKNAFSKAQCLVQDEILTQVRLAFQFLRAHFQMQLSSEQYILNAVEAIKDLFEGTESSEDLIIEAFKQLDCLVCLDLQKNLCITDIYETLSPLLEKLSLKDPKALLDHLECNFYSTYKRMLLLCALQIHYKNSLEKPPANLLELLQKEATTLQKKRSFDIDLENFINRKMSSSTMQGNFKPLLEYNLKVNDLTSLLKALPSESKPFLGLSHNFFFPQLVLQSLEERYYEEEDFLNYDKVIQCANKHFSPLSTLSNLQTPLAAFCLLSLGKIKEAEELAKQDLNRQKIEDIEQMQDQISLMSCIEITASLIRKNPDESEEILEKIFNGNIPPFYQKTLAYFRDPSRSFPLDNSHKSSNLLLVNPRLIPYLVLLATENIPEIEKQLPRASYRTLRDLYLISMLTSRFALAYAILGRQHHGPGNRECFMESALSIQKGDLQRAWVLIESALNRIKSDPLSVFDALVPCFYLLFQKNSQEALFFARRLFVLCDLLLDGSNERSQTYYYISFQLAQRQKDQQLKLKAISHLSDEVKAQIALETKEIEIVELIYQSDLRSKVYQALGDSKKALETLGEGEDAKMKIALWRSQYSFSSELDFKDLDKKKSP